MWFLCVIYTEANNVISRESDEMQLNDILVNPHIFGDSEFQNLTYPKSIDKISLECKDPNV
jgi:hypothetical protein